MFRIFSTGSKVLSSNIRSVGIRRASNLFEPDYLAELIPKHTVYACINIQIKGYDFAVLETYQRFLHRTADNFDLDVTDCWATPAQRLQVTRLKPKSTIVDAEYKLAVYERNIQLHNIAAHLYPIYLRMAQAALPEGVTLNAVEHEPEMEDIRYVPDTSLKELQDELEDLGGARKVKRKK